MKLLASQAVITILLLPLRVHGVLCISCVEPGTHGSVYPTYDCGKEHDWYCYSTNDRDEKCWESDDGDWNADGEFESCCAEAGMEAYEGQLGSFAGCSW